MSKVYGKLPSGERLERIKRSKNYKDGAFQNKSITPMMAPGSNALKTLQSYLKKPADTTPSFSLPGIKTNLQLLPSGAPVIVWFGHSSYFISVNGFRILVDPVFSGNASPFSFMIKAYAGSNIYSAADMPDIDLLIQTHDHYDHMDYKTLVELLSKIKNIATGLGAGAHFEYWGFDKNIINEYDWWNTRTILPGIELTATPARHFSGRGFKRGKSLWSSFVLKTNDYKLYLGGDSGYDTHFEDIGKSFGPFDIAILECGQYNAHWPFIHMMPEETVQASIDLQAKLLLPVHWGKFSLSLHPWSEPIIRLLKRAAELNVKVTTPMIGEPVILDKVYPTLQWWLK